ncbi:MAG: hypothetical protein AB8C95_13165 [Phycisphaeraceae bacterium]
MIDLLAQIKQEEIASLWFKWVSLIMLIGAVAILFVVMVGVARRWKRRQLQAIEEDRAERRAGKSAERVDAWQASAERYVDRDKLSEDDLFKRDEEAGSNDDDSGYAPPSDDGYTDTPEDDRDPFGLFDDKPFQEADDDDDREEDDDEDWDVDDDEEDEDKR